MLRVELRKGRRFAPGVFFARLGPCVSADGGTAYPSKAKSGAPVVVFRKAQG